MIRSKKVVVHEIPRTGGEIDDILYKISRDLEEVRMKNRELSERLNDLEMQFNRLKS